MRKKLYMAYGSNLNLEQMAYRCPTAKPVGTATLKGYQLLFRGGRNCAVATIEPKDGGSVPVLLWEITSTDEAALDRYEGWPSLYRKEYLKLPLNGKPVTAMVYVMNEGKPIGAPSGYYYGTILVGYMDNGLDKQILNKAVDKCVRKACGGAI